MNQARMAIYAIGATTISSHGYFSGKKYGMSHSSQALSQAY